MHIVYVCREYPPSLRGGGIASYIKEMAHGMVTVGHKVTVVCASDDTHKELRYDDDGVFVIRLRGGDFLIPQVEGNSLIKKFRQWYRFNSYRRMLRSTLNNMNDVDIVEVAEYGAESYYLKDIGAPVVVRLHAPTFVLDKVSRKFSRYNLLGWMHDVLSGKEREVIKNARYITSCSMALKNIICKELNISQQRINVIPNPIQVNKWKDNKTDFTVSDKIKLILPGAIAPLKGGEDLIKACLLLRKDGLQVELNLVGKESKFADYLRQQYADEEWLHVCGPIPREELMAKYKEMDIVCNPSWFENLPMVCIEAMLMGCIVVATNVGGIPEIVNNGENGFLVDAHSPLSLADAIKTAALLSELERKKISCAAAEKIRTTFDIHLIVQKMEEYYNYVIKDFNK